MRSPVTVAEALRDAQRRLASSTSPRLDAEVLLARSLGVSRARLYAAPERRIDEHTRRRFGALVELRSAGTPVPYLTGRAEFFSLEFHVSADVLVPRPDTELLVETALERLRPGPGPQVIDLGTGSGAVAAAIGRTRPQAGILASDRSLPALAVARRNFEELLTTNISALAADWLEPFDMAAFDLIVANPPYVAEHERATLEASVGFEPEGALFAGPDGLEAIRAITSRAARCLRSGGSLVLEHGPAQGAAVRALLRGHGLEGVSTRPDLAGRERVSLGMRA